MYKFYRQNGIDLDLYEQRIKQRGYILFEKKKLEIELEYMESRAQTMAAFASDTMLFRSCGSSYFLQKDGILRYLMNYEGCPEHYFRRRGKESYSLDQKKVLNKLASNGYAQEFIRYYSAHRSLVTKTGSLRSLVNNCNVANGVNQFGVELTTLPFNVNVQRNLRFNYRNFDIISQLPKECCNVISVEDGYFLAWGDFAQSDFRIAYNLFLRSEENDKIMNAYEDKYEALARIVANTLGHPFNIDDFKRDRKLYKVLVLATMYGTRDSVVPEEREFIKVFSNFLMRCPKYVAFYNRLCKRTDLGLPIVVESYFGHEESVAIYQNSKQTSIYEALNCPVQTGTSEIVINTVNAILDAFYERGYTTDDASVYFVRHDEPVFRFSKKVLNDIWILNNFTEILVDDWSPLKLDFDFGYFYGVRDESLYKEIMKTYADNEDRIDQISADTSSDNQYSPVADVFCITAKWFSVPEAGKTVVAFYSEQTNSARFSLFETVDLSEIIIAFRKKVSEIASELDDTLYQGIIVINNEYAGDDFFNGQFIKYKVENNVGLDAVSKLARAMTWRFCRKEGIESPVEYPTESQDWISTVNEMTLAVKEEAQCQ